MIELLNERIKKLREEENISQTELAKEIGIAKNTLCQYEKNRANPSLEIILQIADYFNVSVDYLLGRADDFGNIVVQSSATDSLSGEEREVVDTFRKIPDNIKGVALDTLHSFAQTEKRGKGISNKRT